MAHIQYSKGEGFKAWPEAVFDLKILSVEQTVSKSEKPQLTIDLECVEGGEQEGKKTKTWWSLVPEAGFRINELCEACGLVPTDTGEKDEEGRPLMAFDTDDLVGRVFRATNKPRLYNNNLQNDWKELGPSPLQPGAPAAAGTPAPAAAAAPSTSGAPIAARRPRPAPQS
jgi:hypothetical protein